MVILGSTGSIGKNSLEICKQFNIQVEALACDQNDKILQEQIDIFKPKFVYIKDGKKAKYLKNSKIFSGKDGLGEMLNICESKKVINAIVGFAGFSCSVLIQKLGKILALANKESLVVGGKFLNCKKIIPIDSEHFALKFLMQNREINKLIITASGGAFANKDLNFIKNAKASDALKHPNWSMGNKITIDSATMINKLFEILEAFWLYNNKNVNAVIEETSKLHAIIEFKDGSSTAHFSKPDMKLAIAHAILENPIDIISNLELNNLSINLKPINLEKYPIFELKNLLLDNPDLGIIINAANEIAVSKFLNNQCSFLDIYKIIMSCLKYFEIKNYSLDDLFLIDEEVRDYAIKV